MIARPGQPEYAAARKAIRGFTLLELVVAVAVMAVIMVGMGSSLLIASRAMPTARSAITTRISAGEALQQIVTDLQYAVSVSSQTTKLIEFSVPDRDGDDVPETIRYAWSGIAATPLTRQYNSGPVVNMLTDVRQFALSYSLKTLTTETPQGTEGTEITLASYSAKKNLFDYPIQEAEQYAEYFFPALPADATRWRVTRVVLKAKLDGTTDGQARVQLQVPTLGKQPSGVVLEEKTLLESTLLSTYRDQEFTFNTVNDLSPTQGVCIVVKWIANGTACRVQGCTTATTGTDLFLSKTTNLGASWSTVTGQSLLFTVYGAVTTAGTPLTENTYHLEGVDIKLRASSDSQSIVESGVRLLNRPEVIQ